MNTMTSGLPRKILDADSYGPIFMYATHRDLACAPRHIIRMTEPVDPALLQKAAELALIRFPQMRVGLSRDDDAYHYYFIERPPVVLPFSDISPYYMGSEDNNGYLFTIGWNDHTIYMEYQHSLCDGHGFDQFIRSVLFEYLTLCGKPIQNDGSIRTRDTKFQLSECEDGYPMLDRAEPSEEGHYTVKESFRVPVADEDYDRNERMTELTFPYSSVRQWTHTHGATPISLLYTALSFALYRTYYTKKDAGTPVVAEVPLDLRQIVPSDTTHFFVSLLDLPFEYDWFSLPFVDACRKVREMFDTQRAPRHAAFWGKAGSGRVTEGHTSDMGIDEKEPMMRKMARDYVRRDSFILTNIGRFDVPVCMQEYIEDYGAILPCAYQPLGVLVSSYRGTMKVSLAQRDFSPRLAHAFAEELENCGISVKQMSYEYHPTRYEGAKLCRRENASPSLKKGKGKRSKPVMTLHTKNTRSSSRSSRFSRSAK
ncbi:MAG: hypothetical protein Q4F79_09505 [Eubacteriales bacterium]|nr:hypothetical protein [Eubacteriales bacterium]